MTSGFKFETKEELQTAVTLWINYWGETKGQALEIFGDISTWDVSDITDFSSLFYLKYGKNKDFNDDISG